MGDDLLTALGIIGRLTWYKEHYDIKGDGAKKWNCFLYNIEGDIRGYSEMQLHRLSFGPDLSPCPLANLTHEQYQCLASIMPGPIAGVINILSRMTRINQIDFYNRWIWQL